MRQQGTGDKIDACGRMGKSGSDHAQKKRMDAGQADHGFARFWQGCVLVYAASNAPLLFPCAAGE